MPKPRPLLFVLALPLLTLVAGCRSGLSGRYAGEAYGMTMFSIEFQSGGKALVGGMGGTSQATYRVEGEHVVVESGASNIVLTIASDGSLTGAPMGLVLRKQP